MSTDGPGGPPGRLGIGESGDVCSKCGTLWRRRRERMRCDSTSRRRDDNPFTNLKRRTITAAAAAAAPFGSQQQDHSRINSLQRGAAVSTVSTPSTAPAYSGVVDEVVKGSQEVTTS
ncbi:unnamed protein product [Pylaiella littoralis]